MNSKSPASTISGVTETEAVAERLLLAAETIALAGGLQTRDAARYANRLSFALDRVADLRRRSTETGGVFEPARLEVSLSILETHARSAAAFIDPIVAPARSQRTRRDARLVALDVAVEDAMPATRGELAA